MNQATQPRTRQGQYRRQVLEAAVRRSPASGLHAPAGWLGKVFRYGSVLLLALYLLFAHGCHADDEDTELFARPAETLAWWN